MPCVRRCVGNPGGGLAKKEKAGLWGRPSLAFVAPHFFQVPTATVQLGGAMCTAVRSTTRRAEGFVVAGVAVGCAMY